MSFWSNLFSKKRKRNTVSDNLYALTRNANFGYKDKIGTTISGVPHQGDISRIRRVIRDMEHNEPLVSKFLNLMESQVVGIEPIKPKFNFEIGVRKRVMRAAEDLIRKWEMWGKSPLSTGALNMREFQNYLLRRILVDGEVLFKKVFVDGDIRLLPIDVDLLRETTQIKREINGNTKAYGIELDNMGRLVRLQLSLARIENNPYNYVPHTQLSQTFERDEVLFYRVIKFTNQVRGIPFLVPFLRTAREIGEYDSATLKNLIKSTLFSIFVESEEAKGTNIEDQAGEGEKSPIVLDQDGINYLEPGQSISSHQNQGVGMDVAHIRKELLKKGSTGLNISYNSLLGDWEATSYSSGKMIAIIDRDMFRLWQCRVGDILNEIWNDWVMAQMPMGLNEEDMMILRNPEWQGRQWQWLDPQKELNPLIMGIDKGILPPQLLAEKLGISAKQLKQYWEEAEKMGFINNLKQEGIDIKTKEEKKDEANMKSVNFGLYGGRQG